MKYSLVTAVIFILAACNGNETNSQISIDPSLEPHPAPQISYNILNMYPHDTSAFTEGLQIYNGKFYEGTGMENESSLRIADIKTGKVEKKHMYTDPKIFGEGIQVFKGKIYQLTWKNHVVYVYDEKNIDQPIKMLSWPYEGWGMTNNGTDLILSDGSSNLYFVDAETFKVKSILAVKEDSKPVDSINELEYIDGFIFANVWQQDIIIKINPSTGEVVGKMDVTNFPSKYFAKDIVQDRTDVLNGIAYDSTSKKMYITGKRWPLMFELKLN
ncbi:MAG: glutaminyl-peptide cyclotransferase [Bacteroidetes bacterium]|nr:glutaminyl-peptide cyclotransferase [Bacteroidota bacterium]